MTWTLESSIAYECACETITEMIAGCVADREVERAKPAPDQVRIEQLQARMLQLARERRALEPDDAAAVHRINTEYGAEIRAARQQEAATA